MSAARGLFFPSILLFLPILGCGGRLDATSEDLGSEGERDGEGDSRAAETLYLDDGLELRHGAGPKPSGRGPIESVTAYGSGCPRGSWTASVSPDGQALTLVFSQYQTTLGPGQRRSQKYCSVDIKLRSNRRGDSSLGTFFFSGFVALETAGMRARQTASYWFRGPTVVTGDPRQDFEGPLADEFVLRDDVALRRGGAQACIVRGILHIDTRLVLENDPSRSGSGQINTLAADGTAKLGIALLPLNDGG